MEERNNGFSYTYSAQQQEEVKRIRDKYMPQEEDKMARLRKLDESVTQAATAVSLAVGVIGTLLLGAGMSCCMVWGGVWFIPGIIFGLFGIAIAGFAYPLYQKMAQKRKEQIAPEILRLTEELMQ